MGKNNKLINSLAEVARRNRQQNVMEASEIDTPQIYSAVAIALWRVLDEPEETKADTIRMIFAESQKIWFESFGKGIDIEELCEMETGIHIQNKAEDENG